MYFHVTGAYHPLMPVHRFPFSFQLCTHGSVTDLVRAMHDEGASLPEDIIGYLMKEVLSGLSFLHSQHYMHRDVKGQNCLLTTHGRVKLVDFGELQSCEGIIYDIQ